MAVTPGAAAHTSNDPTDVAYWRERAQRYLPAALRGVVDTVFETTDEAETEAETARTAAGTGAQTSVISLDLPEAARAQPLTLFSVEHWLYLAQTGRATDVPDKLAPFPLPLHSAEELEHDLRTWGLVTGDGELTQELSDLLDTLSFDHDAAVWGVTMFPRDAWVFDLDASVAKEYGMQPRRDVVPRVPVLVVHSRSRGEVVSVISTQAGMVMNRVDVDARADSAGVLADELMAVLNPSGVWGALSIPTLRMSLDDVTSLRDVIVERGVGQSQWAPEDIAQTMREINPDLSRETLDCLVALTLTPTLATTAVIGHTRGEGDATFHESSSSVGVQFYDIDDDPSMVVTYTTRDSYGQGQVIYRPGSTETLREGVRALLG